MLYLRTSWMLAVALCVPAMIACGTADQVQANLPLPPVGTGGASGESGEGGQVVDEPPKLCPEATGSYPVVPAPSELLFLLDRSGSMHLSLDATDTRWTATKAGLFTIFDALQDSVHAAVTMFPDGDAPITCCDIVSGSDISCANCGAGELPGPELRCEPAQYAVLPLAMAPLDASQSALMKTFVSTADNEFYWGTPLGPAISGATTAVQQESGEAVSSVILLTDGMPTSCDTASDPDANDIGRAVEAAVAGLNAGVRTYVMGVIDEDKAADAANLSALAMAGGTPRYAGCEAAADCAYSVNVATFADDLGAALEEIALEAMSCSFALPEVDGGQPNYDEVNVTVTVDGVTQTVQRDLSHADGWDYLAGMAQLQLHGPSCELLKSSPEAEVQVVVGCQTVIEP